MSRFPHRVWDGTSATRNNMADVKSPDHEDWAALVDEIRLMQMYLLNFTKNTKLAPNMAEIIKDARTQLAEILNELKAIQAPGAIGDDVERLKEQVKELDTRITVASIGRSLKKVMLSQQSLKEDHAKIKKHLTEQMEALRHAVRNQLTLHLQEQDKKMEELERKLRQLQDIVENPEF